MMKVMLFILAGFCIIGCAPMVGGSCEYVDADGLATVLEKNGSNAIVLFVPNQRYENKKILNSVGRYDVENDNSKIGSRYKATISIISKGSCVPYRLRLVGPEITKEVQ